MPELAINGGTPVRATAYPAWPAPDDEYVAAVTDVVRSGEWGGFPEPGRQRRQRSRRRSPPTRARRTAC